MNNRSSFSRLKTVKGFSLVEVSIAMAIMSVTALTMLGLVPVGLATLRHAIDSTTEGQIVQQMSAQIRLSSFSQLTSQYANVTFYFDEEGNYLAKSPDAVPAATRYWLTTSKASPVYPGSANFPAASPLSSSAQVISLQVVSAPHASATIKSSNTYTVLVPNSGT